MCMSKHIFSSKSILKRSKTGESVFRVSHQVLFFSTLSMRCSVICPVTGLRHRCTNRVCASAPLCAAVSHVFAPVTNLWGTFMTAQWRAGRVWERGAKRSRFNHRLKASLSLREMTGTYHVNGRFQMGFKYFAVWLLQLWFTEKNSWDIVQNVK